MAAAAELAILFKASGVEATRAQMQAVSRGFQDIARDARQSSISVVSSARDASKGFETHFRNGVIGNIAQVRAAVGLLGFAFGALGIAAVAHQAIGLNATLQTNTVAFEVMTGSVESAEEHLADLKKLAKESPIFVLADVTEYSKRLQAMDFTATEARDDLKMLGDIASGVGKDKLPQIVLAYGQVRSAQKLTGMELRQFTEAGVPLLGGLARAYGMTTAEMREMIEDGRVGFESVRYVMERSTAEGGRFHNMSERLGDTAAGAFNQILESSSQLLARGFEPLFGRLSEGLQDFRDLLELNGDQWAANLQGATETVGGALDWLGDRINAHMRAWATLFAQAERLATWSPLPPGPFGPEVPAMPWGKKVGPQGPYVPDIRDLPGMTPEQIAEEMAKRGPTQAAPWEGGRKETWDELIKRMGGGEVSPDEEPPPPHVSPPPQRPPLLPGDPDKEKKGRAARAIREEAGATAELVTQQVLAHLAWEEWREGMRKALETGELDIGQVADAFGEIGKTAKEATAEILKMLDENEKLKKSAEGLKQVLTEIEEVKKRERWTQFALGGTSINRGRAADTSADQQGHSSRVMSVSQHFHQPVYAVADLKDLIQETVKAALVGGGFRGLVETPSGAT
jgi:tape measure domain-containing protein